jgi:hypothetical protein
MAKENRGKLHKGHEKVSIVPANSGRPCASKLQNLNYPAIPAMFPHKQLVFNYIAIAG